MSQQTGGGGRWSSVPYMSTPAVRPVMVKGMGDEALPGATVTTAAPC
jgi:hypothetical protein